MSELKPCPNPECGGSAYLTSAHVYDEYSQDDASVSCSQCGLSTGSYFEKHYENDEYLELDAIETVLASNEAAQDAWDSLPRTSPEVDHDVDATELIEPLFSCQNEVCARQMTHPAHHLSVFNGLPICQECYWDHEQKPGVVQWDDLPHFVPEFEKKIQSQQAEIEDLKTGIKSWRRVCEGYEARVKELEAALYSIARVDQDRSDKKGALVHAKNIANKAISQSDQGGVNPWMPIETAPKSNGSNPFLAYIPGHGFCVCYRVDNLIKSTSSGKVINKATHWMRLPPAPEGE
ncbi:hypothetical protein [Kiloniella litopenaei]|uniref:hypothetical protein n=1 Tax=Kiloniella litopenaei TaxID=1549748 RepID=UPI003BADAB7C